MKKIISAVLAGGMLLSAVPALASDINITINSEEFIPKNALGEVVEPFIESGSTYLPVRAMGEAVGKEVAFDAENYAVYIGTRPMENDVKREPVLYADGFILYEDITFFFPKASLTFVAQAVKLAEEKIGKEKIEQEKNKRMAELSEEVILAYGEMSNVIEEYVYIFSCVELLEEDALANVNEEIYNDFVTVKHILVEDKALADEIIKKIENGEDFDALIEEYNIDPGQTKDSVYTFTYGEMVKEFEKAAFETPENSFTKQPVGTDYGYHIIKKLPLDKASADIAPIVIEKLTAQVESVKFEKLVEVKREGDYALLEGIAFTYEDLALLGDGSDANQVYDALCTLVKIKKFFDLENNLTEEEKNTFDLMMGEILASPELVLIENVDKRNFIAELLCYGEIYQLRLYSGQISEEDEEKISNAEIDSTVFKKIKVFVDGKLIVPADVNSNYVEPKNVDGTVFVPVRAIVEALGMKADWDNSARTVVITK